MTPPITVTHIKTDLGPRKCELVDILVTDVQPRMVRPVVLSYTVALSGLVIDELALLPHGGVHGHPWNKIDTYQQTSKLIKFLNRHLPSPDLQHLKRVKATTTKSVEPNTKPERKVCCPPSILLNTLIPEFIQPYAPQILVLIGTQQEWDRLPVSLIEHLSTEGYDLKPSICPVPRYRPESQQEHDEAKGYWYGVNQC